MSNSVLQDWVMELAMRKQGVLMAAVRGPDGSPKEDAAKPIHRAIRGVVMNCARTQLPLGEGELLEGDSYMRTDTMCDTSLWYDVVISFTKQLDKYNTHYVVHLLHACAIIGYDHPYVWGRRPFLNLYRAGCQRLHFHPESEAEIANRLRDGSRPEFDE